MFIMIHERWPYEMITIPPPLIYYYNGNITENYMHSTTQQSVTKHWFGVYNRSQYKVWKW